MQRPKDKVILITGTRKGIGRYLAEYYVEKGLQVIGCSRLPVDFPWGNYRHFCLDISDESKVKKMFAEIRKTYRRLDVLINNAAVDLASNPVLLVPYRSALRTIEINFLGTFLMSREAAKIMMKNGYGRIINVSSMDVKHESKGKAIYTASKSAVLSLTRVMAKEVYSYGITCNVIAPSAIKSDLSDAIERDILRSILNRNAIPTMGKMEDVSNAIDWLLRPESNAITSQVIYLGGA
ncbi:SDR family oxidoreductase [Acidobacteria bacterium AH-259-L09]|nr:SDR family oxidoreductase [Acidobacteria bacterium AH-259-L09]